MAAAVTIKYQKRGVNFKTTVFQIALTGSYAGPEVVSLTSAASNPGATTVDGPAGTGKLAPRVALSFASGTSGTADPGITSAQLIPTATAGQYNLLLLNGTSLISGAYTNTPIVTVEIDHDMQGL